MSDTKAIRRPGGGADRQAGPLAGLRAVILGQRLGGLVAGMLLSDQGAQVAHVEFGDGVQPDEQTVIDAARRDAIVVTVDRVTGEGVKTAADLLRDADVVVSTVGGRSDHRTAQESLHESRDGSILPGHLRVPHGWWYPGATRHSRTCRRIQLERRSPLWRH